MDKRMQAAFDRRERIWVAGVALIIAVRLLTGS